MAEQTDSKKNENQPVVAAQEQIKPEVREMLEKLEADKRWYRQALLVRPEDLKKRVTL